MESLAKRRAGQAIMDCAKTIFWEEALMLEGIKG